MIKREQKESSPKPLELYGDDIKTPEPQIIEVPVIKEVQVPANDTLSQYLDLNGNGIPDWMEPTFNWDDTASWINNPVARLYKSQIIDKR